MSIYQNPFETGTDRHQLWHMLVEQDIEAFVESDWNRVKDDFLEIGFSAIDAGGSDNPDSWKLSFQTLEQYRDSWLDQSNSMTKRVAKDSLRQALIDATTLRDIEIKGSTALLHKKFDGTIRTDDGEVIPLHWQTLYQCIKVEGKWKIAGFVGYLPHPMGTYTPSIPAKQIPATASQHITAGPYSPVLTVNPRQLVVISGQAAINDEGEVVGNTVQEQTRVTLVNCAKQLKSAGCGFADIFKVNVYLTDLTEWDTFNKVYQTVMPEPLPVRTAIEARLLPGLLVEIEMWAAKS